MNKAATAWRVTLWAAVVSFFIYNTIEYGVTDSLTGILVFIGGACVATFGLGYLGRRWYRLRSHRHEQDAAGADRCIR